MERAVSRYHDGVNIMEYTMLLSSNNHRRNFLREEAVIPDRIVDNEEPRAKRDRTLSHASW